MLRINYADAYPMLDQTLHDISCIVICWGFRFNVLRVDMLWSYMAEQNFDGLKRFL